MSLFHVNIKTVVKYFSTSLFALLVVFAIKTPFASAAVLGLYPSGGADSFAVGQLFSVSVLVSTSGGEPMNAVSGTVAYPTNILQLVSVDKTSSIINFWIGEPTYSNATGQAQFEGGVYNPGFSGSQGKITTFLFKAKAAGPATISFLNAAVLANDGQGTNILDHTTPAKLTIREATKPLDDTSPSTPGVVIRSSTHPDQNAWYVSKTVALSWNLPTGATSVRTGLDQSPASTPTKVSSPPTSEASVTVGDGVSYFHVQVRDDSGWGPVSNFKIQVDSVAVDPPVFDKFPAVLTEGDTLLISGKAPKKSAVHLFLTNSNGKVSDQTSQADDEGHFQTVWSERLDNDTYVLNAEAINIHGIASPRSADRPITVQPKAFERVAWPLLNYATLFMMIAGVIFLCVLWTWYLIHHFRRFRRKVRSDIRHTNQFIHLEFKKLLEEAHGKRKLTAEEERMLSLIREHMRDVEEEIEEDVRKIGQ